MKRSSGYVLGLVCVLILMLCPRPAAADFLNGGFELGDLSFWTAEYSWYHGNNCYCDNSETSPCNPCLNRWSTTAGTNRAAATVVPSFAFPPFFTTVVLPSSGSNMAQIGQLVGGASATRLTQRIAVGNFENRLAYVELWYGVALINASTNHTDDEQSHYSLIVRRRKSGHLSFDTIYSVAVNAAQAAAATSGWTLTGGTPDGDCYYHNEFLQIPMHEMDVGDDIEVEFLVSGCHQDSPDISLHGAVGLLDSVRLVSLCANDCLNIYHIPPHPFIPNAFTPNGDGLNDTWVVSGVTETAWVHIQIWDRWGHVIVDTYFDAPPPSVFYYNQFVGWDGTLNGNPVQIGVYPCRVTVENCAGRKVVDSTVTLVR